MTKEECCREDPNTRLKSEEALDDLEEATDLPENMSLCVNRSNQREVN